jgi:hypothetical protein
MDARTTAMGLPTKIERLWLLRSPIGSTAHRVSSITCIKFLSAFPTFGGALVARWHAQQTQHKFLQVFIIDIRSVATFYRCRNPLCVLAACSAHRHNFAQQLPCLIVRHYAVVKVVGQQPAANRGGICRLTAFYCIVHGR